MNLQNPSEVATRRNYYSVTGVPRSVMDGTTAGSPSAVSQTTITNRSSVTADFAITATHTINSTGDSATVTVVITNATSSTVSSGATGSLKLHVALVEEEIIFPASMPPGTNGEMDFSYVMRKMVPNASGTTLPDNYPAAAMDTYTFDVAIPDYVYQLEEIGFVVFVQDNSTKEVKNAGYSSPIAAPSGLTDISSSNSTAAPADYCATSISPSIDITNTSSSAVTSADIELIVNGAVNQTQSYSGNLAQNSSATINFNSVTISGASSYTFNVKSVNGGRDLNKFNDATEEYMVQTIDPTVQSVQYLIDFETATNWSFATNDFLWLDESFGQAAVVDEAALTTSGLNTSGRVGAYGFSDKSLFINLVAEVGAEYEFITKKVDLSSGSNSELAFSYAYAGSGSGDMMEISASNDCGVTWTSVWSKTGTNLVTGGTISSTFYVAAPSDWATENVDLSAFDGESEVIFKIHVAEGSTNSGNLLYFDNFTVDGTAIVAIDEVDALETNIYPNPANQSLNIELAKLSDVSVEVIDLTGRTLINKEFNGYNLVELNTTDLKEGMYIINITADGKTTSERINIAH